jgi:hypothetical protein
MVTEPSSMPRTFLALDTFSSRDTDVRSTLDELPVSLSRRLAIAKITRQGKFDNSRKVEVMISYTNVSHQICGHRGGGSQGRLSCIEMEENEGKYIIMYLPRPIVESAPPREMQLAKLRHSIHDSKNLPTSEKQRLERYGCSNNLMSTAQR